MTDLQPPAAIPGGTLLSPLEARVVRLAAASRAERASRRGPFGRIDATIDRLTGRRHPRRLADPRLEALRNEAVAVRDGQTTLHPGFVAAGYSIAQAAEVRRIVATTLRRRTAAARRDRATYATGVTLAMSSMVAFIGLTGALMVQP